LLSPSPNSRQIDPTAFSMLWTRLAGTGVRVIEADSRRLTDLAIGAVEFCLTSPPYMSAVDHPQKPLTGYRDLDGHYPTYLAELARTLQSVLRLIRPGGHLVIKAKPQSARGVPGRDRNPVGSTTAVDAGRLLPTLRGSR